MTNSAIEPITLVRADDPERKPLLYACPKCGQCTSPRIFACGTVEADATAKRMAVDCYNCKTDSICQYCGSPCEKLWLSCTACRRVQAIEKAAKIDAGEVGECFGLDGGNFYRSPEDAAEDGEEYVYASTFRSYSVPDNIDEQILDDHHDDADHSDLVGFDELWEAIKKFNKAQTGGSYDEDRTRVALVKHLARRVER